MFDLFLTILNLWALLWFGVCFSPLPFYWIDLKVLCMTFLLLIVSFKFWKIYISVIINWTESVILPPSPTLYHCPSSYIAGILVGRCFFFLFLFHHYIIFLLIVSKQFIEFTIIASIITFDFVTYYFANLSLLFLVVFFIEFFGFFKYVILSSANRDSSTIFFLTLVAFFCLHRLISPT